jgi:FkbM family methyltransferase
MNMQIRALKPIESLGLQFPDNPEVITTKHRRLLRGDRYELKEVEAVSRIVKPTDTVMELGAGIGFMSTVMSKRMGAKTIFAYEANPALIPYIQQVHAINGVKNVTLENKLLTHQAGEPQPFYVRGDFVASSFEDNLGDKHGGVVRVEQVETQDFNSEIKQIKPTVLVMDIEGAEAKLLPKAHLRTLRAVIVELHPQTIGKRGIKLIFGAMQKAGLIYYPKTSNAKVVTFLKNW